VRLASSLIRQWGKEVVRIGVGRTKIAGADLHPKITSFLNSLTTRQPRQPRYLIDGDQKVSLTIQHCRGSKFFPHNLFIECAQKYHVVFLLNPQEISKMVKNRAEKETSTRISREM
jgi:hypothetical protein